MKAGDAWQTLRCGLHRVWGGAAFWGWATPDFKQLARFWQRPASNGQPSYMKALSPQQGIARLVVDIEAAAA